MKFVYFLPVCIIFISCTFEKGGVEIPNSSVSSLTNSEVILPKIENCGYLAPDSIFQNWQLIFEEDFTNDLSQWTAWTSGAFNQELQYYRAENVFVENDLLFIRAARTDATGKTSPKDETIKNFDFASGRIESKEEFGPENTLGKDNIRFSARLRLVEGHGLWPAWWSYNDPWPTKGEIDIVEARGSAPFEFESNFHFGEKVNQLETDANFNDFKFTNISKLSDCFHLYELEWSRDKFLIKFDGNVVKTYDDSAYTFVHDFFNKKHRLVLNLAVGGWFFTDLDVSEIPDESFLVVDWVRVYTR